MNKNLKIVIYILIIIAIVALGIILLINYSKLETSKGNTNTYNPSITLYGNPKDQNLEEITKANNEALKNSTEGTSEEKEEAQK